MLTDDSDDYQEQDAPRSSEGLLFIPWHSIQGLKALKAIALCQDNLWEQLRPKVPRRKLTRKGRELHSNILRVLVWV